MFVIGGGGVDEEIVALVRGRRKFVDQGKGFVQILLKLQKHG